MIFAYHILESEDEKESLDEVRADASACVRSDSDDARPAAELGAGNYGRSAKLRRIWETWRVRSRHRSAAASHRPAWDVPPGGDGSR